MIQQSNILKYILFLSFLFVTISEVVAKNIGFNIFPGARHIILLTSFILCLYIGNSKAIKIPRKQLIYLFTLVVVSFFSFFSPFTDIFRFTYGMFLSLLFVPIFLISKSINISFESYKKLLILILYFILSVTIYALISSFAQNLNLRFVNTVFREAGAFGAIMNIGIIISLFFYMKKGSKIYILIAFLFTFCIILTVLKKSILASFLTWFFYLIFNAKTNKINFSSILILFTIIFILAINYNNISQNISENADYLDDVGAEDHVRIAMFISSFKIASDYFPFGTGFGTFGSVPSIYGGYSLVYEKYGISNIPSNSYSAVLEQNHTLLDTYWPHILGETGFIGFFLFISLFLYPIFYLKKSFKNINIKIKLPYNFFIYSCIFTTILQGFFLYIPELPTFIFVNSGLVGMMFYQLSKINNLSI